MSPPSLGVPIHTRIPADHLDAIDALAWQNKMTRAEMIRHALDEFLTENQEAVRHAKRQAKRREAMS